MTNGRNIEENEKPAKVWQVNQLGEKVDALITSIEETKQLIKDQSSTYPTKTELALELEKRDNKILELQKTLKTYSRVIWIIVGTVVPMVVATVWQLIVNSGRLIQ